MPTLREALDEATAFLSPAWSADRSSNQIDQKLILTTALHHLLQIQQADVEHQNRDRHNAAEGEYDEDSRATLYGLLDLLALQGILPSLSAGVAVKHRPRPVLPSLKEPDAAGPKDVHLLGKIVDGLSEISQKPDEGLAPLIRERILIDVVTGAAELAFNPGLAESIHGKYQTVFAELINVTPTSSALPLLTYLIQPTTPQWLKPHLSSALSIIPLRGGGVRHTIEFIASSYPPAPQSHTDQDGNSQLKGLPLPLDALTQASRLLSAVPSSLDPQTYFSTLAPQLWSMLDGHDGPDFAKAAALIIGSGILGKKSLGAPGAVGWRLFAEPLLLSISPRIEESDPSTGTGSTVVPERDLKLALNRISTLLSSRPSPGLTKRLLARLMLPLWALLDHASSRPLDRFWRETTWQLLMTYCRLGASAEQLAALATNLLWDGPQDWTYAPGSEGGIEVRGRQGQLDDDNIIEQMSKVEQRVASYQDILKSGAVEDQDIGDLFVRLTRKWLLPHNSSTTRKSPTLEASAEEDPLQSLIIAKLVLSMLDKFKDKLAADPDHMIELVKQLLDEWVEAEKAKKKRDEDLKKATYAGLRNIVQQEDVPQAGGPHASATPAEFDSTELLPVALSLLSTIISASNFCTTPKANAALSDILPTLERLRKPQSLHDGLSASVSLTAVNLTTQISALLNVSKTSTKAPHSSISTSTDRETLGTALTDLTNSAPPIRASALSIIHDLAATGSPVIDVPQLTLLLTRSGLSDPEDYVVQHAIRALVALSARDPPLVSKLLADAFADKDEEVVGEGGLEVRLRVGEVLGRVVGAAQEASSQSGIWGAGVESRAARTVVSRVADAAIAVAGRHGRRAKDLRQRTKKAALQRRQQQEAESAWGGPVPAMSSLTSLTSLSPPDAQTENETQTEAESAREEESLERVVRGWRDTGAEEDIRLRTSALSILGSVLESPLTSSLLSLSALDTAVDIALASLALETGAQHAILRRAAAMLVFCLLSGVDAAHETGGSNIMSGAVGGGDGMSLGLAPQRWAEVEQVVRWVGEVDDDAVVKGHAHEALEALETWRLKKALGVRSDGSVVGPEVAGMTEDLGLAGLRGLSVDPGRVTRASGNTAVIEEIE